MASPQRERARRFLVEQGLPVRGGLPASFAAELIEAERRGEVRGFDVAVKGMLDAVARHDVALANRIGDEFLQRGVVPPPDGFMHPGEHVADRDRAATPCVWCVGGFVVETGVMCRACQGASYAAPGEVD